MTGSLQQKSGKYYAVINLKDSNGKRKLKWVPTGLDVTGNKRNAEKFLRDTLNHYESLEFSTASQTLFGDYVTHVLDNIIKPRVEQNTYEFYCCIANAHVIPYFNDKKLCLADISYSVVQDYINYKSSNGKLHGSGGLSPKSVRHHFVIINQVLNEAKRNHLISSNPCEFVTLPKKVKKDADFYNLDELKSFLDASKADALYPLFYVTVKYGLRRSEALGIKWDSIDFESNKLTIKHTVTRSLTVVEKDTTKNNSSRRSYPLTDDVRSLLLGLKETEEHNRSLFGSAYIDNDYVFKRDNGEPYKPDFVSHHFQQVLKANNLRVIHFHGLRHSCASLLLANGFSLKEIADWLGHSDISTTANIYGHLDAKYKQEIANSLNF